MNTSTYMTDTVTITPEIAEKYLSLMFERQRKLDKKIVHKYAAEMTAGRWTPVQTIKIAKNGLRSWLIDGQHTLSAIKESGVTLNLDVSTYLVANEDEAGILYARIDRGGQRSLVDVARSYDLENRLGLSNTDLKAYMAAARLIMAEFSGSSSVAGLIPDTDIVSFMCDNIPHVMAYRACIHPSVTEMSAPLKRGAVFAVGIVTLKYQPEIAAGFWRSISTGDSLIRGDPCRTVREWLMSVALQGGGARGYVVNAPTMCRGIARGWNAHFDHEELKLIKVLSPRAKIVIRGTPYE